MEKVVASSPTRMPNFAVLLRDHFVEPVNNSDLRRELKRLVRNNPGLTLLDVRAEGIRWECEGGLASLGNGFTAAFCATQATNRQPPVDLLPSSSTSSQLAALTALVQRQQEQLHQITQTLLAMQQAESAKQCHMQTVSLGSVKTCVSVPAPLLLSVRLR